MVFLIEGNEFERGFALGRLAKNFIKHNIEKFMMLCIDAGFSKTRLNNNVAQLRSSDIFSESDLLYIRGMAEGASIPFKDLLTYNLYHNLFLPEECTVMVAMKDSTKDGNTLMLKNSDKIGSEKLVGQKYYNYKEINVVVVEKPNNGYAFIAVAAAGEISIKMGLNEKGVATGSNIARTWELKQKKVDLTGLRALDRGWLMREGISKSSSAKDAAAITLNNLLSSPMSTPGNIEFVDAKEAIVIEGSYDRLTTYKTLNGVLARSNRFVILENLNDPDDVSSYARYIRAMQLLNSYKGQLTSNLMINFSQDHENGPGPNSICRHSSDFNDETSLSAAVMEITSDNPSQSVIHICLGKPCHAWKAEDGHITLNFAAVEKGLPHEFLTGEVFKRYYTERPFEA